MPPSPVALMWFRRDLRLHDNAALYHALKSGLPVVPVFVFDRNILDDLRVKEDRRVEFIHLALQQMQRQLAGMGSSMDVRYGDPEEVFRQLMQEYKVEKIFTNHDYEPYAIERDAAVRKLAERQGAVFSDFKDQVIFEKEEVVKDDGRPYTVFTPYSKRWKARLNDFYLSSYPTEKYFDGFFRQQERPVPSLESLGFQAVGAEFPSAQLDEEMAKAYTAHRDFPAIPGTSRLGVHLRFGTISIRELARKGSRLNETFLNELIWRDFYHMILWHFPEVGRGRAFKPEYDFIQWRNNEAEFTRWCEGMTGYPIVDAGMRELNATGYMHNRVRMIVASFLTKHLLIDWRWGEAYFAEKLLDYDFAANNGGWQWAAGSGCDAAPYFRIFNPYLQTEKFDPQGEYIRKWVPEFDGFGYAAPIVIHEQARKRCLEVYQAALKR
ncbi:cryptochrome/photolyase family protein [Flavihumibacter stibioxidans]|uniref:Deoxyribodipyrimidine photolyase n=1 Tax=Flavihumibacter stibioxidans TaxID=1834163 RepID=A0ABR7MBZ4_9BACT|nr:deoxyribodipyrimidine photo-lyase [Flavihumibacter stibioxidans]MBC6492540.1 deoxyribodipyrimidine photolyase [Flavihumibacter stibioxidans]